VIEEPESQDLEAHVTEDVVLATSRIALVEVPRATSLANPAEEVRWETQRLLSACLLVDVSDRVLRAAAELTSREIRTLDAIHLASALRSGLENLTVVTHDRTMATVAEHLGFETYDPVR
jgi:predicted nucleic acid-binding protein